MPFQNTMNTTYTRQCISDPKRPYIGRPLVVLPSFLRSSRRLQLPSPILALLPQPALNRRTLGILRSPQRKFPPRLIARAAPKDRRGIGVVPSLVLANKRRGLDRCDL